MGAGRVPEADEAIEQMGRWVSNDQNLWMALGLVT